ncbi:DHH family phosphoesterase, partial [Candidatus Margulisiibacteriota bacterium]
DACLNPKTLSPKHPFYHLSAAGVVYKFLEYYQEKHQKDFDPKNYLDLAALGTIADVMPLIGENRNLVKFGLPLLSAQKRPGLRQLLKQSGFNKPVLSVRDVAFTIAPRINAAGRLSHASVSLDLLLSNEEANVEKIAQKLQRINEKRQILGTEILKESISFWNKDADRKKQAKAIVLSHQDWHAGIIGITASKLVGRFSLPTVLISDNGEIARGSARTLGNINIYELLKKSQKFFTSFGGHKEAAGFSITSKNIPMFINEFSKVCNDLISTEDLRSIINIDYKLPSEYLTLELAKELEKIQPFGKGNDPPVFYSNELNALDFKTVGDGSHLKATFIDKARKKVINAIGFGLAEKIELLYKSQVEILFNLTINSWQGSENPELQLIDIK